ncbi:xanthine dehydrogenase subunit D [Alkalihalobacillus trypoxylicola]|uniref:Xanthine dehydrogenase subunit D n=1 Tax=Alkalihalobacillus trypoxylicola TaxID=519424 RepID=A0A161Q1G7_9BACI|nr:xanthine dehydrogenase subunit D [Alkalihalobacillus trypoxylicola]KYG34831.1 xanthine dehydrogenase subunit D [Alkalihalobacillus trypoxylicola]
MRLQSELKHSRKRLRPDGAIKVTGKLKYLTDFTFPNMLYGKVYRSDHPHAEILSIDISKAEKLDGIVAILTAKDVPGLNGFGIVTPDQPVLCDSIVRFTGDAIACVAATSIQTAEKAISLIEVTYKPLSVITSPEEALKDDAPQLFPSGNILHEASFSHGEVEKSLEDECDVVISETYELPRQMHSYMETEGGVVVPHEDGSITVYVGTQHGYKDRFQLSRILNLPEKSIRIISSPMGGSFGGKDELNIQPYASLLALKTKRPVKIHNKRVESVRAGIKRHPMKITMKTGAKNTGKIVAHQVKIVADTGAYSTLGPAVLDFAVEHSTGPYRIENVDVHGISVFTNNGVSGEFRGFGGNQVTFALEGQLDRLAERLNICPLYLRELNIRNEQDRGSLGQRIAPTNGARHVLEHCLKEKQTKSFKPQSNRPWLKYGRGYAITMHGGGLGYGRLDPSGGRLTLRKDGLIEIAFGFEEFGQGVLTVIETIVTEELGCHASDLKIVIGDTEKVPSSGSSTASRATSMVWHSVQNMKVTFLKKMLKAASELTKLSEVELTIGPGGIYEKQSSQNFLLSFKDLANRTIEIMTETEIQFPTTPDQIDSGHYLFTFAAVTADVEVDLRTGKVKVIDLSQVISAGPVVNELGYLGQIEGGGIMSLGYSLMEDAKMEQSRYVTDNFDTYFIPTVKDTPEHLEVKAIETLAKGDHFGPRGVGEIGTVAVAPAIVKAVHDATGNWLNQLPIDRERLMNMTKWNMEVLHESSYNDSPFSVENKCEQ